MNIEDFRSLYKQDFKFVFVAVDGDPEFAMKTVEAVCGSSSSAVVGYSPSTNDNLLINCIRAGVREFLVYPFEPSVVEAALVRVSGRAALQPETNKVVGKSFLFIGGERRRGRHHRCVQFCSLDGKGFKKEGNAADRPRPAAGRCEPGPGVAARNQPWMH